MYIVRNFLRCTTDNVLFIAELVIKWNYTLIDFILKIAALMIL